MQIRTKIVSSHTADSKPVKQEVSGTVILPPLVFPDDSIKSSTLLYRFEYYNQKCFKEPASLDLHEQLLKIIITFKFPFFSFVENINPTCLNTKL